MDNFIKKQPNRPSNSVDGMLHAGSAKKTTRDLESLEQLEGENISTSDLPAVRRRLDDFSGSGSFRPVKQTLLSGSKPGFEGRNPRRGPNGVIDLSLPPAPKKQRKSLSWKKRIIRTLAAIGIIAALIVGFLFAKGYLKLNKIFKGGAEGAAALQNNVDPSKLKGEGDGRVNILLLGRGGEGHDGPDLTDTILVASVDPINKKASILSVPRDLYYSNTSNYRVNSVFAEAKYAALARKASATDADNAGFSAIEKVISDDLGIPIHYHVMVDFSGFEQAINTVGGVDLNVGKNGVVFEVLWDEITHRNYTLNVGEGAQHFDGQRALYYARSRHTSARGDFDRAQRQRALLIALKEKVLSLGTFSNPVKISGLLDAFGNHVQSNMSLSEVLRLYDLAKEIPSTDISTIGLVDPPNNFLTSVNIAGQSIQQPRAGLTDFSEIQNYVRNTLKDGFIANENATIAVLNGTSTPGLATTKSNELKSFGYNVNLIGDAPTKTYTKMVLVDLKHGDKKYTRYYLEKRFGVTAVSTLPDSTITNPGNSDFILILGTN